MNVLGGAMDIVHRAVHTDVALCHFATWIGKLS
jgi:hypothetical protein